MGLYWEYNGTKMGMKLKFYRRETPGNEVGMRLLRESINNSSIKKINIKI